MVRLHKLSLFLLPSALLLSACTLGPDFVPPEAHTAPSYAAPGDAALAGEQHLALGKAGEADWWRQLGSPALNDLIAQAMRDNQDIAAAKARLAQAQQDTRAMEGALLPQISVEGITGAQNYSTGQSSALSTHLPSFNYYAFGPRLSFPFDIFGGTRRAIEAKAAYADYRSQELQAVYLTLGGNVAGQALRNAMAKAQIANVMSVIADDERNVALVQAGLDAGSATRTQMLTVQSQLAADRTLLPDFRQQESVSRHALAILLGKAPGGWTAPQFALEDFSLPAEIPASLPSELVHRRPDILAAEAQLHMASAAIGVATANLYPQFNLTGLIAQQALTPGMLFQGGANIWSIAASATQTLFDGGRLSAERAAAINAYQAALAGYQQTVLAAFADVADRLEALTNDADQVHAQSEAARTATEALDLARRSFSAGNSGVLDVIDAQRRFAQAQLGLSRAKAQRLLDTVQLFLALGGTPVPLPTPAAPDLDAAKKPCCDY